MDIIRLNYIARLTIQQTTYKRVTLYLMLKASILLILILFLSSCKTSKDLKGTWVGEYSNSESGTVVFPIRKLLTFKNNKCYSKGSKYDHGTKIRESKKMYFSKDIVFNKNHSEEDAIEYFEIVKIDSDSLVLKALNNDFQYVYRKLPELIKHNQKIDFIGKKFFWKNRKFQDTIYFKSDSILLRKTNKRQIYNTSSWERINYEGFDIIFMDGDVPYLIESQNGRIINLKTFHKTDIEHTLTVLEK